MKKTISIFIIFIFSTLNLQAKSLMDSSLDDFEVENKNKDNRKSRMEGFLDKNFSGYLGASHLESDNKRSSAILNMQIEDSKKWGNYVISGEAYHSEIGITQEYKVNNSNIERSVEYDISGANLLEAYADIDFGDKLTLSLGQKKIIWGQFEPFSPVDFILPTYFSRDYVSYNKTEARVPKKQASLTYFPHPKISLTAYHFFDLEFDPLIEKLDKRQNIKTPSSKSQSAYRAMFYPDFATFGFSYFKGHHPWLRDEGKTVSYSGGSYNISENPKLIEVEAYGFEFSKSFK
jgi:hypothetical protein